MVSERRPGPVHSSSRSFAWKFTDYFAVDAYKYWLWVSTRGEVLPKLAPAI
jgi:hypothetical protein